VSGGQAQKTQKQRHTVQNRAPVFAYRELSCLFVQSSLNRVSRKILFLRMETVSGWLLERKSDVLFFSETSRG
jgi:hypothetical protein